MKQNRGKKQKPTKQGPPKPLSEISAAKGRLFSVITFSFPVLLLVILETALQLFHYGGNRALFVSTPNESSVYYGINTEVGRRYFFWGNFVPTPRKDLFLKKKPSNGYRIFVLGGSTTAGFPYGNNLTFTRILQRRLADTFPNRRIEVVNTAFTAINSYALADFMDEILAQQPDALLIYAGHNEFYGALGVASVESLGRVYGVVKIYLKLQKLKTFLLLRDVISGIRKWFSGSSKTSEIADPMATEMSRIVKEREIPLGSRLYNAGKKQFQRNLRDILQKAKSAGVPVLISELVSNIRDQEPFVSVEDTTLASAQLVFDKARTLESQGRYDEAKTAYYRAKDLDALRFRATEEFNQIIHDLATEFNIPLVPMKSYFEMASPHGLIGNNLMYEHLHPNIDGYFLMADAFYNVMRREKLISADWPSQYIKPVSYYRQNWGFTKLDSTYAALIVAHLKGGWPFKENGPNLALYQFNPSTKEDSIALNIVKTGQTTLELGHIEIARLYEMKGDWRRAFDEYRALIYTVPNLDVFYEPAVSLLVSNQQYERVLELLYDALKYNESFFIYKWIGQMNLVLDHTERGIFFLEKARQMVPDDTQLLFNLIHAYYKSSQFARGDDLLAQLKRILPGSTAITQLEEYKKSVSTL
jgi:lysophospholipase L1-like esterase